MKTSSFPNTTQPPTGSPASEPLMPFGKFRGSRLRDLDPDYLLWVALLPDLRQLLLGHVLREMGRRIMAMDQQLAPDGDAKAGG